MLNTRNAYYFRKFYKEKVARENSYIDINFVGSLHPDINRKETGFSKLIYGNREDIGKLLGTIALNVAADDQAIYELIQNADDSKSSFFSVNYDEKYLLCINNGNYFSDQDMSAIINVAGNYKDGEDIGSFGIGFKILHRLVGEGDGKDAIINDYAGPIIFSWNKYFQFQKFIKGEPIFIPGIGKAKEKYNYERDKENPWLVKLLYTCFPTHYKEPIRLGDYDTRAVKFDEEELKEMRIFLKHSLQTVDLRKYNNLENGSIFFLKLGKGKSKFLDEGIDKIKSGLSYSFKFLNNLKKIYINGEEIRAKKVLDYSGSFPINSKEYEEINPKNKNRDIKFTFAFYDDYKKASDLQKGLSPNLYTFFSMDEEKNGFSFLLHCNAFDMTNDRRKLQPNSQINEKLLPLIATKIMKYTDTQKEDNPNLFLSLYSNFLLSKIPENKPHLNKNFYQYIHQYISKNIPTQNGYSDNPQNVKIKKLKLNLNLSDLGLDYIKWFAWEDDKDKLLIEEAKNKEKLGLEEWDIRDIIENADIESINNWIATSDNETYEKFLKELEESYLREKTKNKIRQIKLFKFSNGNFYSFNDIIKEQFGKSSFRYPNYFFNSKKTERIKNELIKIGIVISDILIDDYPKFFSSFTLPDEKNIYDLIAKQSKENANKLSPDEKKNLFLNLINQDTKFNNVAEGTLKDLHLFNDNNSLIKALGKLIGNIETPKWLSPYKIKQEEYFQELDKFLISDKEAILKEIFLPNKENILPELTGINEIKSLILLYQENQKSFFKEFIIKKERDNFKIEEKAQNTFQVQSSTKEVRKFINENCLDTLFVLPYEFEEYKDEVGIIKADELYNLILDVVDIDEYKGKIIDIVKYSARRKFLQQITEFRFNTKTNYTNEDFEYKILDLACSEFTTKDDIEKFRNKVIIEIEDGNELKLSDIPAFTDKVKIDKYELSLAKILPDHYQNSDYLSRIIEIFVKLGLNKERLEKLFGISDTQEPDKIFEMVSEQVKTIKNAEQLAFIVLYGKVNNENITNFKLETLDEKEYELKYDYYTTSFSFIDNSYILKNQYLEISKIVDLPILIDQHHRILKQPYFENNEFICPGIKEELSEVEKIDFINFIYNQWSEENKKSEIKNIDWKIIGDKETSQILGFNPSNSVFPNKYAFNNEKLPDYLINWIENDSDKMDFLKDLGVWTANTIIVELRKFLKGEIDEFQNLKIPREPRFEKDEKILFNTFEWLKERGIKLETPEQLETFKKVVEVINENRTGANLKILEEFDFNKLKENSIEWDTDYYKSWKETSNISIYLYDGELPKNVSLDEIDDYIFYNFQDGNIAIDNENNIYINKDADIEKELRKLELENNNFDFNSLWHNELEILRKQIELLRNKEELTIASKISTDISRNDQIEANRVAKEIVKEKLENEGFIFTKGIGEFSIVDGVIKDGIEYPLVVKSYIYQDEPLKIGANEWIQLMRPNSMFWVHFGNRRLGVLKLYDLLRKQDKITISFGTENLDVENRLEKFAELLQYFKDIHFDFNSIKPDNYNIADDLGNYNFYDRKEEEDLSADDENIL